MSERRDFEDSPAWVGKLSCGCVVAVDCVDGETMQAHDPAIAEVEETTVADARARLTDKHMRPTCEVLAERDRAIDAATALEQQCAEAGRIAREALATGWDGADDLFSDALNDIVRVLSPDLGEGDES